MDDRHNKFASVDCKCILARSVVVLAGAITECENHPCSFVNLDNPNAEETPCEIASSVISGKDNGELIFRVIFGDSKDMDEMINRLINESGSTCASCAPVTCEIAGSTGGF